jgi:phosphoglycerol transferase MdoB-like AlkP superfamily enzyme
MLLYRKALVMFLFTICRVLFYLFNTGYYPNMTTSHFFSLLLGGMRFDALALVYVNSLYLVAMLIPFKFRYNNTYQKVFKFWYVLTNSIAIAANCIDIIYFRFTMRRTTATVFDEFSNEGNILQLFGGFFIQYWYIVLIFAAMVFILIKAYGKLRKPERFSSPLVYYPVNTVLMLVGVLFMFFGMRGHLMFHNRPISLANASEYVKEPIEMPIVQSTPFTLIKTLTIDKMPIYRYYSENELAAIFTPEKDYQPTEPFRYKNVVIFILESYGAEFISAYNKDKAGLVSYTPFLDSLMRQSRYYLYSYANGRKSIDAMPSILASIPSIVEPYVLSPYSANHVNGIATILREEGYKTAFFHNAYNGAMGFNGIANLMGFEEYYGMDEFGDKSHYDGIAGIFDEEFFQFYAQELNKMPQPFCTALFSLSSHTPFNLPERYKDVFKGDPDAFRGSLRYSDYALQRFFETASQMPWYDSTLFVLAADHGGIYSMNDEYKTTAGVYAIPIVFYAPGDSTLVGMEERLAQQADILPSVLSYLSYRGTFISFGTNLLEKQPKADGATATEAVTDTIAEPKYLGKDFAVQYVGSFLQLMKDDYMIQFDGQKTLSMYKFKEDTFLSNNLVDSLPDIRNELEQLAKAFLQQYTTRMDEDRLSVR